MSRAGRGADTASLRRCSRTGEAGRRVEDGPTDNHTLECALAAGSEFLVTGDKKHLLPLGSFRVVSIIGLRDFVVMLAEEG